MHQEYYLYGISLVIGADDTETARFLHRALTHLGWRQGNISAGEQPLRMKFRVGSVTRSPAPDARKVGQHRRIEIWREPSQFFLRSSHLQMTVNAAEGLGCGAIAPEVLDERDDLCLPVVHLVSATVLLLLSRREWFPLHGAALQKNSLSVLLVGPSGSGKSTSAFALVDQGWSYLSDDSLLLRRNGQGVTAYALRREFGLDWDTSSQISDVADNWNRYCRGGDKGWIDMDELFPGQGIARCEPDRILFAEVVDRPNSAIVPVDPTEALTRLMRQSLMLGLEKMSTDENLQVLRQLVSQADTHRLLAGRDMKTDFSLLDDMLSVDGERTRTV